MFRNFEMIVLLCCYLMCPSLSRLYFKLQFHRYNSYFREDFQMLLLVKEGELKQQSDHGLHYLSSAPFGQSSKIERQLGFFKQTFWLSINV